MDLRNRIYPEKTQRKKQSRKKMRRLNKSQQKKARNKQQKLLPRKLILVQVTVRTTKHKLPAPHQKLRVLDPITYYMQPFPICQPTVQRFLNWKISPTRPKDSASSVFLIVFLIQCICQSYATLRSFRHQRQCRFRDGNWSDRKRRRDLWNRLVIQKRSKNQSSWSCSHPFLILEFRRLPLQACKWARGLIAWMERRTLFKGYCRYHML